MFLDEAIIHIPEVPRDAILAFYKQNNNRLALLFTPKNKQIYKNRPIKSELVQWTLIRYLLDLSELQIVCPGQQIIDQLYYNNEEGYRNNFEKKPHCFGEAI